MSGFEPRTSDVGSDRSVNCATTTDLTTRKLYYDSRVVTYEKIATEMAVINSWKQRSYIYGGHIHHSLESLPSMPWNALLRY